MNSHFLTRDSVTINYTEAISHRPRPLDLYPYETGLGEKVNWKLTKVFSC